MSNADLFYDGYSTDPEVCAPTKAAKPDARPQRIVVARAKRERLSPTAMHYTAGFLHGYAMANKDSLRFVREARQQRRNVIAHIVEQQAIANRTYMMEAEREGLHPDPKQTAAAIALIAAYVAFMMVAFHLWPHGLCHAG